MSQREVTEEGTDGTIGLFVRRHAFVERLREEPLEKRAMTEALDVSRSTVDRAVRELEDAGIVEFDGGEYGMTPFGTVVADAYAELEERVDLGRKLEPVYRWVSPGDLDVAPGLFADAEVYVPRPGDPYAPLDRHAEKVHEMVDSRAVLPMTGQHATEGAYESIVENGATAELVVTPEVLETHHSSGYERLFSEIDGTDRLELFVTPPDLSVPYALVVFRDVVQLVVAEGDEPRALLESDSPAVREWAEATYERYRDAATPVEF